MARSDFVSVHAPLTGETEGLIDSRRLALMKPTAYLVNLSEARIVDRDGLAERTRKRGDCGGRAGRLRDPSHRSRPSAAGPRQRHPDAPRGRGDGRDDRAPLGDDGLGRRAVPGRRAARKPGESGRVGGAVSGSLIVVVDAGSTRIRCLVFDERGEVVVRRSAPWSYLDPGAASPYARELDAEGVWGSTARLIAECVGDGRVEAGRVAAVTVTSQRQGVVFSRRGAARPVRGPERGPQGHVRGRGHRRRDGGAGLRGDGASAVLPVRARQSSAGSGGTSRTCTAGSTGWRPSPTGCGGSCRASW